MVGDGKENYESAVDSDFIVLLDSQIYPDLQQQGLVREFINRIQRLRKKAGLDVVDRVVMQYNVVKDKDQIVQALQTHADMIQKILRGTVEPYTSGSQSVIIEDKQDIQDTTVQLRVLQG